MNDFHNEPRRPNKFIVLLVALAIILSFALGFGLSYVVKTAPKVKYIEKEQVVDRYSELYEFLDTHYYEDFNENEAALYQLLGIVESLDDPYTRIVPVTMTIVDPVESDDEEEVPPETFEGLGISYQYHDYYVDIASVMRKSPAEKAKIFPGDHIIGIVTPNGTRINFKEDKTADHEVQALLKGKAGDEKTLILRRPNGDTKDVTVTYERFSTPTVEIETINENIGYLKISAFEDTTASVFKEKLQTLEEGVLNGDNKTLIIDLRDNPGGYLAPVGEIMDSLLPNQTVPIFGIQNTKSGRIGGYFGGLDSKKPYDIKVLVNGHSASASEMLAAALHYTGGYTVYGQPTFGKNVYQNTTQKFLGMGFELTYTEGYWFYTENGINNYQIMDKETKPIPVELLDEDGFLAVNVPTYSRDIEPDTVDMELINVQKFLKAKYNEEIRTDGYFDNKTKELIERYQTEKELRVTGSFNLETHHEMYIEYFDTLDNIKKDPQVGKIVEIVEAP